MLMPEVVKERAVSYESGGVPGAMFSVSYSSAMFCRNVSRTRCFRLEKTKTSRYLKRSSASVKIR